MGCGDESPVTVSSIFTWKNVSKNSAPGGSIIVLNRQCDFLVDLIRTKRSAFFIFPQNLNYMEKIKLQHMAV
jgi:hypothetical protein